MFPCSLEKKWGKQRAYLIAGVWDQLTIFSGRWHAKTVKCKNDFRHKIRLLSAVGLVGSNGLLQLEVGACGKGDRREFEGRTWSKLPVGHRYGNVRYMEAACCSGAGVLLYSLYPPTFITTLASIQFLASTITVAILL